MLVSEKERTADIFADREERERRATMRMIKKAGSETPSTLNYFSASVS